jgi:Ca-activated chloride channel family protein
MTSMGVRQFAVSLLLLIPLAGTAYPQEPRPYQLSVNVDLVVLNATVRDQKGSPTSNLREQDFEVYEDGVRQTLRLFRHDDIPVTVGLVIDHSGSMRAKIADVVAAARTFVQSSSPDDQMFVVNFNENVTVGLPPGIQFTNRPEELARAIANTPTTGRTALYDAVVKAREHLAHGMHEKKVLLVISDGGDNASVHTLDEVLRAGAQSGTLVYTIGIFDPDDPDKNPGVLKRMAQATGGEAFFPAELKDVVAVCERIARDIRSQYTLGYLSSNEGETGAWREIKVVARGAAKSKLSVRTRSGYFGKRVVTPEHNGGGR